jgi:hypothetical protein
MPIARRIVLTASICVTFLSATAAAEPPKNPARQAVVQQFDANGNGKLGRMEKAAARPTVSQRRSFRALFRNNRIINTIR